MRGTKNILDKFLKIYASEFPEHLFSMLLGRKVDKKDVRVEKTELTVKTRHTDYKEGRYERNKRNSIY